MEQITLEWVNPKETEPPLHKDLWVATKNANGRYTQTYGRNVGIEKMFLFDDFGAKAWTVDIDKVIAYIVLPDNDNLPEWVK